MLMLCLTVICSSPLLGSLVAGLHTASAGSLLSQFPVAIQLPLLMVLNCKGCTQVIPASQPEEEELPIENLTVNTPSGFEAVSYTHLDVYKRQPLLRISL